jgi:uncharacterized protein (TIGR02246 family)
MKKAVFLLGILLVTVLSAPQARADSKDEKEIKALENRLAAALKSKDADAVMSNYVADASLVVFDVVPPRQYVGAKSYRKNWQDFFNSFPGPMTTWEVTDLSIMTDGNLGASHSIQHLTWNDKDGKQMDVTIRVTDVYRKIGDKWLIAHEHLSVPVDPETGKADFSSAE